MSDKPHIRIRAAEPIVSEYRRLLTEDWSSAHTEICVGLIRSLLAVSGFMLSFPWELETPTPSPPKKATKPQPIIPPNAAPYVREFIERFDTNLPEPPEHMPQRQDLERVQLAHLTETVTAFLAFQSFVRLDGDISFFMDCQSLLFSSAVHELWRSLASKRMTSEQKLLTNYLWMHATIVWDKNPSHKFFLLSQLHDLVGDKKAAADALRLSFETCAPTAHDWITKAQAYWAGLIELGDIPSAKEFALSLYRNASREHLSEIAEIIDDTYDFESRSGIRIRKRRNV